MSTAKQKIASALTLLAEVQQELVGSEVPSDELLLTADEVASRLGLKTGHTVRLWPRQGCPHVRAGRLVKYRLSEVIAWCNGRNRGPSADAALTGGAR